MSELIRTLATTSGIRLRCGVRVTNIYRQCDGWKVTAETRAGICSITVPRVVLATPADITASIINGINNKLSSLLREIEYAPIAVLHLGLNRRKIRHPLDGTGFLVPRGEKIPFNGNLWMSSLFPERAPRNKTLLTT